MEILILDIYLPLEIGVSGMTIAEYNFSNAFLRIFESSSVKVLMYFWSNWVFSEYYIRFQI